MPQLMIAIRILLGEQEETFKPSTRILLLYNYLADVIIKIE